MSLQNYKRFTYADDTALVFTGNTWYNVCDTAECGLHKINCC